MNRSRLKSVGVLLPGTLLLQTMFGGAAAHAADATSADTQANDGLEEITVTASRREESQSKVPVSITAFTQKTLDQNTVRTLDDIAKLTPGVQFDRNSDSSGSVANISIRGIKSDAGSGATGVYIDDTPIQSRSSVSGLGSSVWPQVFDLERVEVLRGPQGTLFGAGSEGGTVRLITPQPSTTVFDAYARADLAFTQGGSPSTELGAAVNLPLIQGTLGLRVSASQRHDGGYVNRVDYLTGNVEQSDSNYFETSTLRVALAYKATDTLTITPSFYWQEQYVNDTSVFWEPLSNPSGSDYNQSSTIPNTSHDRFILPAIKGEWVLPGATLVSNTSFFDRDQPSVQNLAFFEADVWASTPYYPAGMYAPSYDDIHQRTFTQELRVQSQDADARLTWLGGIFYQHARQHVHQRVQDTFLPELIQNAYGQTMQEFLGSGLYENLYTVLIDPFNTTDRQLAGFGQVDFKFTDKLKGTVGLRYSKTDFSASAFYAGPVVGPTPRFDSGSSSEKPVTPKFGLSYQLDSGTMLYTTVAKGYRAGGYNNPLPVNCGATTGSTPIQGTDLGNIGLTDRPKTFKSDSLWSYELGSKTRAFDGKLAVDASVYVIKWKDIQFADNLPMCGFSFTTNAGNATSKGFELSVQARPLQPLELGFAVGYVKASYDGYAYAGTPTPGVLALSGPGDRILVAPLTVALDAQWTFSAFQHDGYFRVNYNYADGLNHNLQTQDNKIGGYDPTLPGLPVLNDLSAKLGAYLGPVNAAVYVNNLANQHPLLGVQHATASDPLYLAATVRPRTIGITASYRY